GLGAYLSIAVGGVPTGPLIVLTLFAFLVLSLLLAPGRSLITRVRGRARQRRLLRDQLIAEREEHIDMKSKIAPSGTERS
ncbi:hypothetical protein BSP109_03246, partial [Brevibacterium sp. Mu109]